MQSKLKILSLGLLLSGVFGLAACDTVEAKLPENEQSEQILVIDKSDNIPHNEIEELFEKVLPGDTSTASKVLDTLLFRLAKSYYGVFYDTLGENNAVVEKGLRSIVKNDADIAEFVANHKKFQIVKEDGTHDTEAEKQGVKDFYEHLMDSIRESFWSYVGNSSYQDHYLFSEKKFYDTQKAALYHLDEAYGEILDDMDNLTPLDGLLDKDSVDLYFGDPSHEFLDIYQDYIERSLLPDLYRKVIVENYVINNNYSAIGRSHARKVQTISLKNLDESADATRNLVTHYAKYILEGGILDAVDKPALLDSEEALEVFQDLKFLSELYNGTIDVDAATLQGQVAKFIYEKANWASDVIDTDADGIDETFYPLTTLGKIYKDYKELSNVRWETSSSTDFTGSGAYTKETGLMYKRREILSKNSATEGWFTSSGLSELPSEIRSRLFKIKVANEVDANYSIDDKGQVTVDVDKDFGDNGFGRYVNGHYYLTPETYDKSNAYPYLMFDSGSSSWVIVRVDEAVKGPKLSTATDSKTSYDYLASLGLRANKDTQNEIVWEVTGMISDSDSYKKAARQEVLEEAKITYHDQNVYDYFSTNFPDLFD